MRQIKFRGLDNANKWAYGHYATDATDDGKHYIVDAIHHIGSSEWNVDCVEVDGETVDQFTGNSDIKGVEIYENDIVRVRGFNYVVAFLGGCWVLKWGDTGFGSLNGYNKASNMTTEVIGNIHQNPELIEDDC